MRLLVVDDDPSVREALELVLDLNGFGVSTATDGAEAIRTLAVDRPDAVILDVLMPGLDGLEVCRRMRAIGDRTPVLMLTARAEISERVAGLEAGADDYLVKPFASEELVARLRALLRRTGWEGNEETMRFEDLELDPLAHEARRNGRQLELTRTEFLLLELLMRHPRQVLSRTKIFECVWGYDFGPASNSLEVYVGYLRRKTEAGGEPRLVHTVRGVGYVLRSVHAMSFRRRMILLAAGAVAAAVVIASVVVYVVTRNELQGQLDSSLRAKITPGQQSAVQIKISGTRSQLAKLAKEGKLPLPVAGVFGFATGAGASGAQASGAVLAPAPDPGRVLQGIGQSEHRIERSSRRTERDSRRIERSPRRTGRDSRRQRRWPRNRDVRTSDHSPERDPSPSPRKRSFTLYRGVPRSCCRPPNLGDPPATCSCSSPTGKLSTPRARDRRLRSRPQPVRSPRAGATRFSATRQSVARVCGC